MKNHFSLAATMSLLAPVAIYAQGSADPVNVAAYVTLTTESGVTQTQSLFIAASTADSIRVVTSINGSDYRDLKISSLQGIYLVEPPEYLDGLQKYADGKFNEAAASFEFVAKKYARSAAVVDNYCTLSQFYYAQCMINLERWKDVDTMAEAINMDLLPLGFQQQVSIFPMWGAYGQEDWDRVMRIHEKVDFSKMPPLVQAQEGFLAARAFEEQGNLVQAKIGYSAAFTLNYQSNSFLAQKAADRLLAIYAADEDMKKAIAEGDDLDKNSPQRRKLQEAASIAYLYHDILSDGAELPAKYKVFLPYLALAGGDPVGVKEDKKSPDAAASDKPEAAATPPADKKPAKK